MFICNMLLMLHIFCIQDKLFRHINTKSFADDEIKLLCTHTSMRISLFFLWVIRLRRFGKKYTDHWSINCLGSSDSFIRFWQCENGIKSLSPLFSIPMVNI